MFASGLETRIKGWRISGTVIFSFDNSHNYIPGFGRYVTFVKDIEDELDAEKKQKESQKKTVTFTQIAEGLASNYDDIYYKYCARKPLPMKSVVG